MIYNYYMDNTSSPHLSVVLTDQIEERLERVKEQTGLSKSEIARRGIIDQVKQLES